MKNFNTFIVLIIFIIGYGPIHSQNICSTEFDITKIKEYRKLFSSPTKDYDGEKPIIRLSLNRIVRSDGSGGNGWTDIRNVVQGIHAYFNNDICFTVVEENEIKNDIFFNMTSFHIADPIYVDLLEENLVHDAVSIYFIADAAAGAKATGFFFPNNPTNRPTVALSNFTGTIGTFNSKVLSHELGHCFGLLHTHETALGTETVVRSGVNANCGSAGDLLCDTEADFNINFNLNNIVDANCNYIGNNVDVNGDDYDPDPKNIMSYSLPPCLQHFSPGQINRMREFILDSDNFNEYTIDFDVIVAGIKGEDIYIGAENTIESSITHNGGAVDYLAEKSITLVPGFQTNASNNTTFNAKIGLIPCLDPLVNNSGLVETEINTRNNRNSHSNFDFNVSPIPTNGLLEIFLKDQKDGLYHVEIIDLTGNLRLSKEINLNKEQNIILDLSKLQSGVYFIRVSNHDNMTMKKIVKL